MSATLLNVQDLRIGFGENKADVVDGISFSIAEKQTVGLVGESGSGKSLSALSLLRLTPPQSTMNGQIIWRDHDILSLSEPEMRSIRGKEIGMIFQNPLAALNPVYTIGEHFVETLVRHYKFSKKQALDQAISFLSDVKIPHPEKRIFDYPHQFSLGMCQRVMIALTLAMSPTLLIADEPTASLDVTVQAQILGLLSHLKNEKSMSMLLISHDLGIVSQHCDWVLVMYQGQVVEQGTPEQLFSSPQHPYTQVLINAIPTLGKKSKFTLPSGSWDTPISFEGCRFAHRCPLVSARCHTQFPPITKTDPTEVRCWARS